MGSGSWRQADVKCPFYCHDDGKKVITCEGITDDCSTILRFRKQASFENQLGVFCSQHYEKCEICRMLMEKYDG